LDVALSLLDNEVQKYREVTWLDVNRLHLLTPTCPSLDFDPGTVRTVGIRQSFLGRVEPLPTIYPTEHDFTEKPDKLVSNASVLTSWVYFNGKDILLVPFLCFPLSLLDFLLGCSVNVGGYRPFNSFSSFSNIRTRC
jgi:hypothetical protein